MRENLPVEPALLLPDAPVRRLRVLVGAWLERLDVRPAPNHSAPVACLGGRGEVAVAEGVDGILRDAGRLGRVRAVVFDLFLQVREVVFDTDVVLFGN